MAFSEPAASGLRAPALGWWTKVHGVLLLVALVVLLVAGQGQHFFYDEWAFIGGKLDAVPFPDRYLLPHNEHWTLFPLLAYRALRSTVGVGSYWPYLGLLLLMHLGVTHVLWRLMLVIGSTPIVATSFAAVFSVLGAGAEDLVWAFQIAFVGSTLSGLTAIYLAVTGAASWRRTGALAFLTLAGLATSGVGLAYLIIVPFVYAFRNRRQAALVFFLPLLTYGSWSAVYGHSLTFPPQASATLPLVVGAFVVVGLATALSTYAGFYVTTAVVFLAVGLPLLAVLILGCRRWIADRTLASLTALAMCVGAVAFLSTAGLARGGLGLGIAASPRYVYVCIAILLPAIALVVTHHGRHPRLVRAVVPVAVAMAASNVFQLMTYADQTRQNSNASLRVLMAASDLVNTNTAIFADQLPEPQLAPDLTTTDLMSRNLDPAFGVSHPESADRLTASLNLQIRVAPDAETGKASTCRTLHAQQITVPANPQAAPRFAVKADDQIKFTLSDAISQSAQRVMPLAKGTYTIHSQGKGGTLTLVSSSATSLLANC